MKVREAWFERIFRCINCNWEPIPWLSNRIRLSRREGYPVYKNGYQCSKCYSVRLIEDTPC